jgi:hypothetical protein
MYLPGAFLKWSIGSSPLQPNFLDSRAGVHSARRTYTIHLPINVDTDTTALRHYFELLSIQVATLVRSQPK